MNNVILVGRVEPPLSLALSVWLLKERVSFGEFMGAIAAFVGVTLTILLQPPGETMMNMAGLQLGLGELLVAVGSVAIAISTIIGKKYLSQVSLGIYSVYRTALGTIIFFFLALGLYGSDHFTDVFSPFLWQWMFLYGGLIVVVGQSFWTIGLKSTNVSTASLVGSFAPLAGIIASYLILGEVPTMAQYIGGSLILVGIFISQVSNRRRISREVALSPVVSIPKEQKIEMDMGFKGI